MSNKSLPYHTIPYTDRVTDLATLQHHTKFHTEKRFAGQRAQNFFTILINS